MTHKFKVGEIVTTSKCSFLENRIRDSSTITARLPRAAEGFSYLTRRNSDEPEQTMAEGELELAKPWKLSGNEADILQRT
jgi:hypothetical protein